MSCLRRYTMICKSKAYSSCQDGRLYHSVVCIISVRDKLDNYTIANKKNIDGGIISFEPPKTVGGSTFCWVVSSICAPHFSPFSKS